MNKVLQTFTLGFLLRSVFSGAFFVISFFVASHGLKGIAKIDGTSILSVALPVALFTGVIAYGLHRSLIYPWFEKFFDSELGKRSRGHWPLISSSTIATLLWRWGQNTEAVDRAAINVHLDRWADFIHLQYTSALCVGLGALVGVCVVPGECVPYCPLIVLASVFLLAGLISNWRSHSVLDYVKTLPEKLPQAPSADPAAQPKSGSSATSSVSP